MCKNILNLKPQIYINSHWLFFHLFEDVAHIWRTPAGAGRTLENWTTLHGDGSSELSFKMASAHAAAALYVLGVEEATAHCSQRKWRKTWSELRMQHSSGWFEIEILTAGCWIQGGRSKTSLIISWRSHRWLMTIKSLFHREWHMAVGSAPEAVASHIVVSAELCRKKKWK